MSQDESHLKVLKILEVNPRMNQRSLSEALGISLGKTNYCINALLDKGLIKVQNFRTHQNKLAYTYFLTPDGLKKKSELTLQFLKQKMADYEALRNEIEILKQESKLEMKNLGGFQNE